MSRNRIPTAIDRSELAYHREAVERFRRAQALKEEVVLAEAAFRSWAEHLHAKYKLDALAGDGVDEHGQITRGPRA